MRYGRPEEHKRALSASLLRVVSEATGEPPRISSLSSGRGTGSFNPATGEQAASVPIANAADVADAVAAAVKAAPGWAATTPLRRGRILNRFLRILEERISQLADVIVAEHGKVHSDAIGEIQRGMEVVEFATVAPQLLKGRDHRERRNACR
jgi:malonate-semialdehyde dehydrogenase (acetylating)/methylmalonate-semialdehyde dehydrogenase